MGTQLIFTVGTNPLPVWVAWYHLKGVLEDPIHVRLIHTPGTINEKDRLERYCQGADFLDPISISPGTPGEVHNDIEVVLEDNLDEFSCLHVHYTGGTKVMSVETVAALEYGLQGNDITYDTSYLDPRSDTGPIIVDSYGNTLGPADARQGVPANLQQIANLNGFTLAPFVHEYWDNANRQDVTENIPAPMILDQAQEGTGNNVLERMAAGHRGMINPTHFEYVAYVALREVLERIQCVNPTRNNYKLFNKVHVRRTGASRRDAHFELDVVAVLVIKLSWFRVHLKPVPLRLKKKGWRSFYGRGNLAAMRHMQSCCVMLTKTRHSALKKNCMTK